MESPATLRCCMSSVMIPFRACRYGFGILRYALPMVPLEGTLASPSFLRRSPFVRSAAAVLRQPTFQCSHSATTVATALGGYPLTPLTHGLLAYGSPGLSTAAIILAAGTPVEYLLYTSYAL